MRSFNELSERELLALAISNEEEDGRIYADYALELRDEYPASAKVFEAMAVEENEHRRSLIDLFVQKFGEHIPLVRRQDIKGTIVRRPVWHVKPLSIDRIRAAAETMEADAARFYRLAAQRTSDAGIRKLLGDLAAVEDQHQRDAAQLETENLTPEVRKGEDEDERRRFILQIIQPGLVGLMDGSVSTLAPVFAAAFATHVPWNAFLVGMAASVGAGISMGFAEALADDGKLSGRGTPLLRGVVCGLMTVAGGIGHTLPYLIPQLLDRDLRRGRGRGAGIGDHRLYPVPLHGHPAALGHRQGDAGRRAGARRRHPDRQFLNGVRPPSGAAGRASRAACGRRTHSGTASAIGDVVQMVRQRLPVADMGDLGEGDRRADHHRQRRADARFHLVEDQRDAQGVAEMAGDLEQPAVLAAEPDRHDRRPRSLDQRRDERLPAPVDRRAAAELVGRGRNGAGGKHHDHPAPLQMRARGGAAFEIGRASPRACRRSRSAGYGRGFRARASSSALVSTRKSRRIFSISQEITMPSSTP